MKFNVFANLEYEVLSAGTLILNVHALQTPTQAVLSEILTTDPVLQIDELFAVNGENRLARLDIPGETRLTINYNATVDCNFEQKDYTGIEQISVSKLDAQILPFLYPSRYCQSDKLARLANNLFGHITDTYQQVQTLTYWIYHNVKYLSGSTDAHTSAFDTVTEQVGVCRDFAHLGIALCRALTIPARYFTGYAYQLQPPDFHACFEAYIGGDWVIFDATRLAPLNGIIKIATGRDAADSSVANMFGDIALTSMQVGCELADENFAPFYR